MQFPNSLSLQVFCEIGQILKNLLQNNITVAPNVKLAIISFCLTRFFPNTSQTSGQFMDIFLPAVKFPDISWFSQTSGNPENNKKTNEFENLQKSWIITTPVQVVKAAKHYNLHGKI